MPMNHQVNMDLRIEAWKKKLLDLGKRNRLLNYHDTKRGSIRILEPSADDLWNSFVVEERSLGFPYVDEDALEDLTPEEVERISQKNGDVRTNKSLVEQQKTLMSLRSRSRTYISEQGVNVLYLSFGILQWTEATHSQQVLESPIILVPASLQCESITSPYVLSLHDDEIVVNPTLSYKLENDFGLTVPVLSDDESAGSYLDKLRSLVTAHGWTVQNDVCLSLLSFSKINMYKDLERHGDAIASHPIIRALAGDSSEMAQNDGLLPDSFDHDGSPSFAECHLVVDADSSQMDAVECAKRGVSFVLQGPPGTGKSQTITNIIAESLADEKKVLFVSEKMAALDVVHRRLESVGLGDFCLVLHSHKANKKDVLAQLGASLNLSSKRIKLKEEEVQTLDRLRDERELLNGYARDLHTPISPLGRTIFDANGILSAHSNAREMSFEISDARNVTSGDYERMIGYLRRYERVLREMGGRIEDNPWRGARLKNVSNALRHDVAARRPTGCELISHLIDLCDRTRRLIGVECCSISDLRRCMPFFETCCSSPHVPPFWAEGEALDRIEREAAEASSRKVSFLIRVSRLNEVLRGSVFEDDLIDVDPTRDNDSWRLVLGDAEARIRDMRSLELCFSVWDGIDSAELDCLISDLEARAERMGNLRSAIGKIYAEGFYSIDPNPLLERFGSVYDRAFLDSASKYREDRDAVHSVLRPSSVGLPPSEIFVWLDKAQQLKELRNWATASSELAELNNLQEEISRSFEEEIESIPYNEIYLRFKEESSSLVKFLNRQYREDKKLVSTLIKGSGGKAEDVKILDALSKLRRRDELVRWRDSSSEFSNLTRLERDVNGCFVSDVLALDCSSLSNRYSTLYTDAFLESLAKYNSDVVAVTSHLKDGGRRLHEDISRDLALLHDLKTELMGIEELAPKYERVLGEHYEGVDTDFVALRDAVSRHRTLREASNILDSLDQHVDEESAIEPSLSKDFRDDFAGFGTDWDAISAKVEWARRLMSSASGLGEAPSAESLKRACAGEGFSDLCADLVREASEELDRVPSDLGWFMELFSTSEALEDVRVTDLFDRFDACVGNLRALENWVDYSILRDECNDYGLGDCVKEIERAGVAPNEIIPAFQKRFYTLWLDSVLPEYPTVANFRRRRQDSTIEEFRKLDRRQFGISRSATRASLVDSLPSIDLLGRTDIEVKTLLWELNKKRKIKPIRRLFSEIPNLVMTLRPCLMMSPLSVSLFLEASSFEFDIVIFDEASQVCTENAVGAIFRGKQVVIAGDSKQLPPTNFFEASLSESDYDGDDDGDVEELADANAFESVLDEAAFLPSQKLLWHYRSRDERLIAFSNAKIYGHELVTFPSPNEGVGDCGVEYEYVPNGMFDRGGSRANYVEAERVAELVFDHFIRNPSRSLGVIAFSSSQEAAIDTAIRRRRKNDSGFEAFFDEEKDEAFFVKNLENVQGDERDTIIFSIGYAKNSSGVMHMNFGPLSRAGGERRLNVAITRAKYNVKLVGSILPTDIQTERISADGPKLLRSYIEYAIHGEGVLEAELSVPDVAATESPFEDSVYDFLTGEGYRLATQVGCLGYRIDMAVRHPTLDGRFVLGIECDGATYHSARTARDRDRLRQEVLEGMGWKIYRIWSTDWIKDPATEKRRLLEAVRTAIDEYVEELPSSFTPPEPEQPKLFEEIEERKPSEIDEIGLYRFAEMKEPDYDQLPANDFGQIELTDAIDLLVSCKYPIHGDVIAQELCSLMGYQRASSRVKMIVNAAIDSMESIELHGEFVYPKGYSSVPAYGGYGRPIKLISVDELCSAMLLVARGLIGSTRDSLIESTARAYGFNRTGAHISNALNEAFDRLVEEGKISLFDDKVKVAQ